MDFARFSSRPAAERFLADKLTGPAGLFRAAWLALPAWPPDTPDLLRGGAPLTAPVRSRYPPCPTTLPPSSVR